MQKPGWGVPEAALRSTVDITLSSQVHDWCFSQRIHRAIGGVDTDDVEGFLIHNIVVCE